MAARIVISTQILSGNLGDDWSENVAAARALAAYTERMWRKDLAEQELGLGVDIEFNIDIQDASGVANRRSVDVKGVPWTKALGLQTSVEWALTDEGRIWEEFCDSPEARPVMDLSDQSRLIFDNGGGVTLQLGNYATCLDDMAQAAEDTREWLTSGSTEGWDGHDPDAMQCDPTQDEIRSGGYYIIQLTDAGGLLEEASTEYGGNLHDFFVAFAGSEAALFLEVYGHDTANIMEQLELEGIESDQDWESGKTTWTFPDGSRIKISGPDLAVEN